MQEEGIESTKYIEKQGRFKKQRIEIEVIDGERASSYTAKIIEGYWIQWKEGRQEHKKIIGTLPRVFEHKIFIFWRRGLKYYIKRNAEVTHEPDAAAFILPQAKFAMRLVKAVIEAETFVEIAKATKGQDRKIMTMWMVLVGFMGLLIMLGTGGYFK